MDVLLVSYYETVDAEMFENLGLEIIDACLSAKNISSKLIYKEVDSFKNISILDIEEYMEEYKPKIVAIPVFYPNVRYINNMLGELKEKYPGIVTISGGALVSQSPMRVMETYSNIDIGAIGEGEETMPELISYVLNNKDISTVAGIIWRRDGEVVMNETRPPVQLDNYPLPNREILSKKKFKYVRISASRGCFGVCKFCVESRTFKAQQKQASRWRGRNIVSVVDEIEEIKNKYGVDTFNIIDNSFEDPTPGEGKEKLRLFAEEILRRNMDIFYTVFFRCETFNEDDYELLLLLKKSGLMYAFLGVESGCNSTLRLFSKIANKQQNLDTIRLFEKADIYIGYGFILFHPYTSIAEIKENIEFLKEVPYAENMLIYTNKMQIFYDVPFYNLVQRDGLLTSDFSIENPFGYRFQDERMGWALEQTVKMLDTPFKALWKYSRYIDSVIQKAKKYGTYVNMEQLQEVNHRVKKAISAMNLEYMSKLVELMENDQMDSDMKAIIDSIYPQEQYDALDLELKQMFKKVIFQNRKQDVNKIL